jgi:hypothetical protein
MRTKTAAAFFAFLIALTVRHALAQNSTEDWPCVQRKVPTISAGAIWSGPDLASASPWSEDSEAAQLAQKLASRRVDLDEADRLIEEFAKSAGREKDTRLVRVFAGALELINAERDRILQGIQRYARGQRLLADRIREQSDKIGAVRDEPAAQPSKDLTEVERQFAWDKRIFEERRRSLTYVCETPIILERRAFEIARRIQERL